MVIHKRKLRANLLYKCLLEGTLTQRILLLTNFRELARLTLVRVITAFLLAKTISRSLTGGMVLIDRNEWNEIKSASSDISPPLKVKYSGGITTNQLMLQQICEENSIAQN